MICILTCLIFTIPLFIITITQAGNDELRKKVMNKCVYDSLRDIFKAQESFKKDTKENSYSKRLQVLGLEIRGRDKKELIDSELAKGLKCGYTFSIHSRSEEMVADNWGVCAWPLAQPRMKQPSFYIDESGVIRMEMREGNPGGSEMPKLK